jgi:probable HAF family extracellular repeat protein
MKGTGLGMVLVAGLLACAGAASTASVPKFELVWSHGAVGTDLRLVAVADDGSAAGTFRHQDSSQHAVFFNGQTVKEIGAKIGPGSVATDMNDRHQIVGYRSLRPNVTTGDLTNSKLDDSQKPHAFLYGGGKVRLLTQPSYATAVNDEGVVVGTFLTSDQSLHAFAWLTGGLRWAPLPKNKFIDLGAGSARAVNTSSTSWNVEIAGPADAAARYYTLNVLTGKFSARTVNLAGAITTVNTASRGGGYQVSKATSFNQLPVLVNLRTGRMTALGLPAPFTNGVVNVVTDAGDPFGDLFNQAGDLEAATWVKGRPVNVNSWFTKAQLLGHKLTGIADANTNGQFVGSAEVSGDTWAYIASPTPAYKLANVVAWVAQTSQTVFAHGTRRALTKAYGASKRGASADTCKYVHQAVSANYADLRKVGFYPRNALIDDLDEIEYELHCGGKITLPHGMPFHR